MRRPSLVPSQRCLFSIRRSLVRIKPSTQNQYCNGSDYNSNFSPIPTLMILWVSHLVLSRLVSPLSFIVLSFPCISRFDRSIVRKNSPYVIKRLLLLFDRSWIPTVLVPHFNEIILLKECWSLPHVPTLELFWIGPLEFLCRQEGRLVVVPPVGTLLWIASINHVDNQSLLVDPSADSPR